MPSWPNAPWQLYGRFGGDCSFLGLSGCGTIFKITTGGALTTLHSFDGTDGSKPAADPLLQATNGILYGQTYAGGTNGDGTVFSLSLGLEPFVEILPTIDKVGAHIKVLGSNLTGATAVSFNGTAAEFKVVAKTLIEATIPTGATSGEVEVATPTGTLKSNTRFVVRP